MYLRPVADLAVRLPQLLQLIRLQALCESISWIDDDCETVVCDFDFGVSNVLRGTGFLFGILDRTGGVANVGFAGAEPLEAAAGARCTDRDTCATLIRGHEFFSDRFGDWINGTRSVDADGTAAARTFIIVRFLTAAAGDVEQNCDQRPAGRDAAHVASRNRC